MKSNLLFQIQTSVGGLSLYSCDGEPIRVAGLDPDNQIQIDLHNIPQQVNMINDYLPCFVLCNR